MTGMCLRDEHPLLCETVKGRGTEQPQWGPSKGKTGPWREGRAGLAADGLVRCPGRELVRPKEGGRCKSPGSGWQDEGRVCRREDPGGPSGDPSQVPRAGLDLSPSPATPGSQSHCPSQFLPAPSHFFGTPPSLQLLCLEEQKPARCYQEIV